MILEYGCLEHTLAPYNLVPPFHQLTPYYLCLHMVIEETNLI